MDPGTWWHQDAPFVVASDGSGLGSAHIAANVLASEMSLPVKHSFAGDHAGPCQKFLHNALKIHRVFSIPPNGRTFACGAMRFKHIAIKEKPSVYVASFPWQPGSQRERDPAGAKLVWDTFLGGIKVVATLQPRVAIFTGLKEPPQKVVGEDCPVRKALEFLTARYQRVFLKVQHSKVGIPVEDTSNVCIFFQNTTLLDRLRGKPEELLAFCNEKLAEARVDAPSWPDFLRAMKCPLPEPKLLAVDAVRGDSSCTCSESAKKCPVHICYCVKCESGNTRHCRVKKQLAAWGKTQSIKKKEQST